MRSELARYQTEPCLCSVQLLVLFPPGHNTEKQEHQPLVSVNALNLNTMSDLTLSFNKEILLINSNQENAPLNTFIP